jgi:hypothetical protein
VRQCHPSKAATKKPSSFAKTRGSRDQAVQPTEDDLKGGDIGLVLFVDDGWLSEIRISGVGVRRGFKFPTSFPPAECFEAPRLIHQAR